MTGVATPGSKLRPSTGTGTNRVPNNVWENLVLTYNPWAKWPLNEPAGSTSCSDHSGNGRTLTPDSPLRVTLGITGLIKTSADTCSYSTATAATNVYNFLTPSQWTWNSPTVSAEFWINAVDSGHELSLGAMGRIGSSAQYLFRFSLNTSGNPVMFYQTAGPVTQTASFGGGALWTNTHQLVFVLDGSFVSCYIDGLLQPQIAQVAALNQPLTNFVYLGQPFGGSGSRYFSGYMGPVVWYTQALSQADVTALYNAATTT